MSNKNIVCVGIDLSLDSTGICVRKNGSTEFYNILNARLFSKAKNLDIDKIHDDIVSTGDYPGVSILMVNRTSLSVPTKSKMAAKKSKDVEETDYTLALSLWEREHLQQVDWMSEAILEVLLEASIDIDDIPHFYCIENYNYGADTSNLVQICELTMMLKHKMSASGLLSPGYKNLYLVTGPEVKMFAGNGGYTKYDMLQSYKLFDDPAKLDNPLYKNVEENVERYVKIARKKGKSVLEVTTPMADLVDAYFIATYLEWHFDPKPEMRGELPPERNYDENTDNVLPGDKI